jgi:hypothetical protein
LLMFGCCHLYSIYVYVWCMIHTILFLIGICQGFY